VNLVRALSLEESLAEAAKHSERCERIVRVMAPMGRVLLGCFGADEEDEFLDIAWQELFERTRVVTPSNSPRTLRAVAKNVHDLFGSFRELSKASPQPGFDPVWFERCAQIETEGFNWSRWDRPWLIPAEPPEARMSQRTKLYLLEGNHSSAVLALWLRDGKVDWRPVEVILVDAPRAAIDRVAKGEDAGDSSSWTTYIWPS